MNGRNGTIDELRALVAKQAAQIEKLTARIAELELALAKAKKDSSTSSKPPSSDIAKPKPKPRPGRPRKRRKGGQPGHQRQLRQPLPPERVDETIDYEIDESEAKRLDLTLTGDFNVIQHIELPDSPVRVTEHRLAVYQAADGRTDVVSHCYLQEAEPQLLHLPSRLHHRPTPQPTRSEFASRLRWLKHTAV